MFLLKAPKSDDSQSESEEKGKQETETMPILRGDEDHQKYFSHADFYATKGLDLCSVLLGCDPSEESPRKKCESGDGDDNQKYQHPYVSASALGLESVLDGFPSFGFGGKLPDISKDDEQLNQLNPNSINVIKFDARSNATGNTAALAAIAQDFFDLEAEQRAEEEDGKDGQGKYKNRMDDLFSNFDISDE